MPYYYYIIIIIIVILLLSIIFYKKEYFNSDINKYTETNCFCVFDIDGTINCNEEAVKNAVNTCKKRGCKFAINTARILPDIHVYNKHYIINDIDLNNINLELDDIIDNIYTGDWSKDTKTYFKHSVHQKIADTKVKHLETIHNKYSVPKKRIILFDDMIDNITYAKNHGFSTILANNYECGLNEHVSSDINDILDK